MVSTYNKISESHLNYITDDQLKELCPILGTRIELRKHISEYLLSQAPTETESSVSDNLAELPGDITLDGDISFSLTDLFKNKPTFKDFDLNTLLTLSPWGKSITEYYYMNGCLDIKRRNRLTDIIIRHLFTFIVNSRLTYEDYNIITGKIITLFPKESAATYFTNPIRKSDSFKGKSIAARGKLIDKVRNVLYESGERKRKRLDTYSNIVQEGSSLSQFAMESSAWCARDISLRAQKKFLSRVGGVASARALILDEQAAKLLDQFLAVLRERVDKKEAEKLVKHVIKAAVKIGVLRRHNQLSAADDRALSTFRSKFHTVLMAVVSFCEVEFSYDRAFLQAALVGSHQALKSVIERHLSDKSVSRLAGVFALVSRPELLDSLFSGKIDEDVVKLSRMLRKELDRGLL